MELYIDRTQLRAALQVCAQAAKGAVADVLRNVSLTASGDSLTLRATNGTLGAECVIECAVRRPGATMVDLAALQRRVADLPAHTTHITLDGSSLSLVSDRVRFSLPCMSEQDYSALPEPAEPSLWIAAQDLRRALSTTRHTINAPQSVGGTNGVHVHADGDSARFVSSNGHCLIWRSAPCRGDAGLMAHSLIGPEAVDLMLRVPDTLDEVCIGYRDGWLSVSCLGVSFVIRTIDGEFPEYGTIATAEQQWYATASRDELAKAARRANGIASKIGAEPRAYATRIDWLGNEAKLSARHHDKGTFTQRVAVETEGRPVSIGVSARYLATLLSALSGDDVVIGGTHPMAPITIRARDDEQASAMAILMPARLD